MIIKFFKQLFGTKAKFTKLSQELIPVASPTIEQCEFFLRRYVKEVKDIDEAEIKRKETELNLREIFPTIGKRAFNIVLGEYLYKFRIDSSGIVYSATKFYGTPPVCINEKLTKVVREFITAEDHKTNLINNIIPKHVVVNAFFLHFDESGSIFSPSIDYFMDGILYQIKRNAYKAGQYWPEYQIIIIEDPVITEDLNSKT